MILQTAHFVWWIVLLLLSAFFSGMEVAFVSADKFRYALEKKSKGPFNTILNTIYANPRQFLGTMTAGNILVLVLFVYFSFLIGRVLLQAYIGQHPLLIYLIIILAATFIVLLTGEFIPRAVFRRNPHFWVKMLVVPAFIFYVLLYPLVKLCLFLSWLVLKLFGVNISLADDNLLKRVDLDSYVKQGLEDMPQETDVDSEVRIFRNALDFSSMKLRDCMVPRTDIVAVSDDTDIDTLKLKFVETGISRILVYHESIDNIIGYIHMWEMFNNPTDWTKNVASISFVPESMQANKLMSELMQQHKSIAVVIDEFGGTSGIITMEDLVEEIFGEIEDEYDMQAPFIKQESDHEFVLSGRVEIDHFNEQYGAGIPESDEYSTIAGYLLHYTQRFPKTYETIVIENFIFTILKVTSRKIEVVRLQIDSEATQIPTL